MAELFSGPAFRCFTSRDVIGVEIGGAVKNVVAIAAGMYEGRAPPPRGAPTALSVLRDAGARGGDSDVAEVAPPQCGAAIQAAIQAATAGQGH